jgi:hypothetical protein
MEPHSLSLGQRRSERSTRMDSNHAKTMAARNLTDGATLDELRQAARDLRALSPESALAALVEAKIEQMMAESEQTNIEGRSACSP